MTPAEVILALVTLQRLAELVLSRANASRLVARGAYEVGPGHYPLIFALHAAWLLSLWIFGHAQPVNLAGLAAYLVLQLLRGWVMWTLGSRWTTRILILPGRPLISSGPYRYLSHPNYAVVTGEIALLPLTLNLPWMAAVFTVLNGALLALRIKVENRALASAAAPRDRAA
jgi:methyltransferase